MLAVNGICVSMIYPTTLSLAKYMRQITIRFLIKVEEHERISGCRHEVDKIYALLGYFATHSVKSLMTFRDKRIGPILKGQEFLEEGTNRYFPKRR